MPMNNDSETLESSKTIDQNMSILNFAMDNIHEAVFLIDNNGQFRFVNEETCKLLGYSRDILLTMSVSDINPDFPNERWINY